MKELIDAIKRNADAFAYTAERRASTTPSDFNRRAHTNFMIAVKSEDWGGVERIVSCNSYRVAFTRLVWCLNMHSSIDSDEHSKILKMIGEN